MTHAVETLRCITIDDFRGDGSLHQRRIFTFEFFEHQRVLDGNSMLLARVSVCTLLDSFHQQSLALLRR